MIQQKHNRTGFSAAASILLVLLPLAAGLVCICIGRYSLTPKQAAESIFSNLSALLTGSQSTTEQYSKIVWSMRLPRVLLALMVGGGLSAAGVAFQSLFANPLATPDTLGVASGASLGAALGLLMGMHMFYVQLMALLFGFLAVGLTFLVSRKRGSGNMTTVVLSGMVIASLFSALVSLVKYTADTDSQLPAITYWLMGSLSSASWQSLRLASPFMLTGIILLFLIRWRLNILPLSEDEARATGVNIGLLRLTAAACATMMTAASVAMCGQVAWIGLLIPHVCRMAFGSDTTRLLPASICIGAAFMAAIDTIARSVTASEIPISILTAIIGEPFFIHLLRQTRGWNS